ncbi:hypothetical protein D9756_009815 [Leucocoprinus leucothites]|uniref:Aminoglycoside phosphotransferase domain-containing protein n=1 Tax=Leucocoprinus leucothites TaxID=201217 RepID=A0A8H5FTA6_9AGAR|nr:hypothetical protein D9756_009815 [Leucoagaricus leucothites]
MVSFASRNGGQSTQFVTIDIYGDQGSGKRTLRAILDDYSYTREQDSRNFFFRPRIGSASQLEPASLSVVLVDATGPGAPSESTIEDAQKSSSSFCFLLTKTDLIAADYSDAHLAHLHRMRQLAYRYNVDSISVNALTIHGVADLVIYAVNTHSPLSKQPRFFPTLWRRLRTIFTDCLAACFTLPTSQITRNIEDELATIHGADDLLRQHPIESSSEWTQSLLRRLKIAHARSVPAILISPSLIWKQMWTGSEPAALEYVHQHTSIPIPRVHAHYGLHMIMDYIEGEMLLECWDRIGWFMRFRVACTLRLYIKQLRSLTCPDVRGVGTRKLAAHIFGDNEFGPFESTTHFRRFCDFVCFTGWESDLYACRYAGLAPPPLPEPTINWTPVFTHGDLNMSNILLDKNGTVWLIDWDSAGFYPASIESLAMLRSNEISQGQSTSWERYRAFIAGIPCKTEEQYWRYIEGAIDRFTN